MDPTIYGTTGNDSLTGTSGTDTIRGDDGMDAISGEDGNDVLYGGDDDDYINGGAGNDTIYGGRDHDKLVGGMGNDSIVGTDQNGSFDPMTDHDVVDYSNDANGITGTLYYDATTNSFSGSEITDGWGGNDSLASVAGIHGSAYDDSLTITITGADGKTDWGWHLWGGAGQDTLTGTDKGRCHCHVSGCGRPGQCRFVRGAGKQ